VFQKKGKKKRGLESIKQKIIKKGIQKEKKRFVSGLDEVEPTEAGIHWGERYGKVRKCYNASKGEIKP